jgi:hypothetical protein
MPERRRKNYSAPRTYYELSVILIVVLMEKACFRRLVLLVCALALLAGAAHAQHRIKIDWQPIAPEDLAMKENPAAPGEHAMILYREYVLDSWGLSVSEYVRIKVFTQEGRKWADVQIPHSPGVWEIKDLRARTILPDGRVLNFDGQVFDEVTVKSRGFKVLMRKFSLPDVQPGSIIEYMYRIQYGTLASPSDDWILQGELFTRLGVFVFRPFPLPGILRWRGRALPTGLEPQKQLDGSYRLEIHNLPGVKNEEFMPPKAVVRARVGFFFSGPQAPPNEPVGDYWNRLAKGWSADFEKFVSKKKAVEAAARESLHADDSPELKLRELYARAQQIRNLDYEPEKTAKELKREERAVNETVDDVLKHGYGTSPQINAVFIALARSAGFESSPAYVGSRDEDFFTPDLRDAQQLDCDIAYISLKSGDLYLDPGDPYFPYGLLPWFASGVQGVRLKPDGGEIITTTAPLSSDATLVRHAELKLGKDGTVSGTIQVDFTGQRGCARRQEDREKGDLDRRKGLTDQIKSWLPPDSTFEISGMSGWDTDGTPLHIEGTLEIRSYFAVTGKRLLLPATIFRSLEAHAFQDSARVNQIYFQYPFQEQDDITFQLPAGFAVESLPAGQKTPKSLVEFDLEATQGEGAIHVHRRLVVDAYSFPVSAYSSLRAFFGTVASADEQQVVLRAVEPAEKP